MKNKDNKIAALKAAMIFIVMFAATAECMLLKFGYGGSFERGSDLMTSACLVAAASILLLFGALYIYVVASRKRLISRIKNLAAICTVITLGYVAAIASSWLGVMYMPLIFTALVLVQITARNNAFFVNLIVNVAVGVTLAIECMLGSASNLDQVVYMMIVGIFVGTLACYVMREGARRIVFILLGILMCSVQLGAVVGISFFTEFDFAGNWGLICLFVYGQIFVALLLQPILEWLFNILTNSKLIELTDSNAPLIKLQIEKALGTYNHALAVASFAEICALRIGENPYLAKACAYYHDVGKLRNPRFFSENQSGYNPHDELLPEVSAKILRDHTTDGYELCQQYRIPAEIAEVTLQHHGTLPMIVFYVKAKNLTDGEIDESEYSYHGKTPVSKIAAIIMVCDAAEAALRSRSKPTAEEVDALVGGIIADRIARHQFDDCDITMRDLNVIKETIIGLYGGVYHERVQYPSGKISDNE